ncbi:hypothetical protein SUGI_0865940 [Cryptomeria japonica]|nr:hypothetical protein SUGI_0865940 [Cryptomeria japonica]
MAPQGNSGCVSEKLTDIFNMGVGSCDVIVGGVSKTKALARAAIGGEDILQNIMRGSIGEIDVFIVELMRYENIEEEMVQLQKIVDFDLICKRRISSYVEKKHLVGQNILSYGSLLSYTLQFL